MIRRRAGIAAVGSALAFFPGAGRAASNASWAPSGLPMTYLTGAGLKAGPVVPLTWFLLAISLLVMLIIGLLVLAGVLVRKQKSHLSGPMGTHPVERPAEKGLRWISIGVAISAVPLIASTIWTVAALAEVNEPPSAAPFVVEVTGRQWWWDVRYLSRDATRTFRTANEIHIPAGRPVRFVIRGGDVIHSFWVPALGGKMDAIPGQSNSTWFEASRPGRYRGQCTEYCGVEHAHMIDFVIADPPARFDAWWNGQVQPAAQPAAPDAIRGEQLFVVRCGACHTVRGTDAGGTTAPDLTHLMSRETIAAGAAPNTPAGLSGWIANPQGVKPGTHMPTLYLSGPELAQVRAFLLTLK